GIERIADGVGDIDPLHADERNDVAGLGALDVLLSEAVEDLHLRDLALHLRSIALGDDDLLPGLDGAVVDASDADAADVVVVLNAADADLEGFFLVAVRRGNVLEQGLEDGRDVLARLFELPR